MKLDTPVQNTWCPGCPNFGILGAAKKAVKELVGEGYKHEEFVTVSGIGCHAKIYDYINTSGFYGLHGRAIPVANGIVLGNPNLKVLTFAGDGDAYAEGISHFVHAARMNPNYVLTVHNNKVFALTTGQVTPTSEQGYPGKSTPGGNPFIPMNPVAVALEFGASFVAREYAMDLKNLAETMKAAVRHKGFAFIDVIQPCLSFHNFTEFVGPRMYRLESPLDRDRALEKAREWDYSLDKGARIPVGVFHVHERPTLEESFWAKPWHLEYPRRNPDSKAIWGAFGVG